MEFRGKFNGKITTEFVDENMKQVVAKFLEKVQILEFSISILFSENFPLLGLHSQNEVTNFKRLHLQMKSTSIDDC